jgi:NRAMP (natural resistance-associated macrophage protein)-like metal ion transporter
VASERTGPGAHHWLFHFPLNAVVATPRGTSISVSEATGDQPPVHVDGAVTDDEATRSAPRKLFQVLGPGLITGASDDDPSGIATYSQVGAQFGYGLAWTLVFSYPLKAAIQEISARIGRVTGFGIAGNLRRHYSVWLSGVLVLLLLSANLINLGADLGAMGAALKLLIGGPALLYVVLFSALSAGLQIFTRYARYVSILKWGCLALFSYVICAFVVNVAWGEIAWAIVWPPLSFKTEYLMAIVAVMGTTISPYLFFWQAEQEVEDIKEGAGARPLTRAPEQASSEFARIRLDTYIGMAISNLVAFFIVITTGRLWCHPRDTDAGHYQDRLRPNSTSHRNRSFH